MQLPLLDRLMDEAPGDLRDPPLSPAEAMAALRASVRRDLEALLNARRRWQSWPESMMELATSPLGFGMPDFSSGSFSSAQGRERLRSEVEATVRRFEPRFARVRVTLVDNRNALEPTLRLRIDALLRAEPAPEPVAFDTVVDATSADVVVRASADVLRDDDV